MRIFIVSKYGSSQNLAVKLIEEKHIVSMYIRDRMARKINIKPFVVDNLSPDMLNVDLFLIEDDNSGEFARKTRELHRPTIGGSLIHDQISKNNEFLTKVIEGCDLKIADKETKGIPVNLGGWFQGKEFLRPYLLGIRYTRVGAGDVGHQTKGMGIVGQYKLKGNLFGVLRKLETLLTTANYQGFVNLQLYINNESVKVTGMELGLFFPTVALIAELHNIIGTFLFKVAVGTARQVAVQPDRVGIGVVWLPNMDQATISPTMVCQHGGQTREVISKVYKDIHRINNDTAYYRVDIGASYDDYLKQLKHWEWI